MIIVVSSRDDMRAETGYQGIAEKGMLSSILRSDDGDERYAWLKLTIDQENPCGCWIRPEDYKRFKVRS